MNLNPEDASEFSLAVTQKFLNVLVSVYVPVYLLDCQLAVECVAAAACVAWQQHPVKAVSVKTGCENCETGSER